MLVGAQCQRSKVDHIKAQATYLNGMVSLRPTVILTFVWVIKGVDE